MGTALSFYAHYLSQIFLLKFFFTFILFFTSLLAQTILAHSCVYSIGWLSFIHLTAKSIAAITHIVVMFSISIVHSFLFVVLNTNVVLCAS